MQERPPRVSFWYDREKNGIHFAWPSCIDLPKLVPVKGALPPEKLDPSNEAHVRSVHEAYQVVVKYLAQAQSKIKGPVDMNPCDRPPIETAAPTQETFGF